MEGAELRSRTGPYGAIPVSFAQFGWVPCTYTVSDARKGEQG